MRLLPAVMAASIDLGAVRVVGRFHNPVAAFLDQSVVRGPRIYWANAPIEATTIAERAHLAHELVHVWQYEFLRRSGLEILMHRRYRYELSAGTPFAAYGFEQQAAIVEDAVRIAAGAAPRWAIGGVGSDQDYASAIASCPA
ncbi:MAG: hypothetical protein ABL957_13560 [Parvularculaceae bacterium]